MEGSEKCRKNERRKGVFEKGTQGTNDDTMAGGEYGNKKHERYLLGGA
jgi:hypothetical protein